MPTLSSDKNTTDADLSENNMTINGNDTLTFDELNESYAALLKSEANDFISKSLADLQVE